MSRFTQIAGSQYQRRELRNYLRYALSRGDVSVLFRLLRKAARVARTRQAAPAGWVASSEGQRRDDATTAGEGLLPLRSPGVRSLPSPLEIPLATRTWSLAAGPPWRADFADPEDRLAAHRFSWLQPILARAGVGDLELLTEVASSWMQANPAGPGAPGWDSYSIAERIANWAYLVASAQGHPDPQVRIRYERLRQAIRDHAAVLRLHLEMNGEATNNHLINDGRALYLAGALLGTESLRDEGRQLLAFGARRMFDAGCLREGSTHYHLLLCRTYVEQLALARASGDTHFAEDLAGWVRPMVQAAEMFAAPTPMPLIGDISPDFDPSFLRSVAAAGRWLLDGERPFSADGWAALYTEAGAGAPPVRPLAWKSEAGYFAIRRDPWAVFAFVNPLGFVPPYSHGHGDLGSFVLSWKDQPVLVDSGRSTYLGSALGAYGRSVRSHNTLSIDRNEPCLIHGLNGYPELLDDSYYRRPPKAEVSDRSPGLGLRIEHPGFARLSGAPTVVRTIDVDAKELTVTDEIGGNGTHLIETFFQFHPNLVLSASSTGVVASGFSDGGRLALQSSDGGAIDLQRGTLEPEPAGWCASKYGSAEPCVRVRFHRTARLPTRSRYVITPA